MPSPTPSPALITSTVVTWARTDLRDLPWRRTRDPWAILVAETMLQQTQVSRVIDRWRPFLDRFPEPSGCASATGGEVVRVWEGLGYNRRAVMLHRAASLITALHNGRVPRALGDLMDLPGVGPYTARAVLAFAFEVRAAPVDTNVGRVIARLTGRPLERHEVQELADSLVPLDEVWLYNQGVMELGATICTKRTPRCGACPVACACRWRGEGRDPAIGSAGVSRPQAPFDGSDRQRRGALIDALRRGPMRVDEAAALAAGDNGERSTRLISGLVGDGLVELADDEVRLVGDGATRGR